MPGISGLEALAQIKEEKPSVPVVMITKSEEERIMEEAIGNKIADYLIKPVNPNQILLTLKKNLDQSKLVSQTTNANYQQEFRQLGMQLGSRLDAQEWSELYQKLVYWELELENIEDSGMREILEMQKKEANAQFSKMIADNYLDWISGDEDAPVFIHQVFKEKIAPIVKQEKVCLLVIDNLRFDQWKVLKPKIEKMFRIQKEEIVYSILPTATHYARNAFFSGLMPSDMAKSYPNLWLGEDEEGGKNMHEKEFLQAQMTRLGLNERFSYHKITNYEAGKKLVDQFSQLKDNQLNVVVYNFVDMLSHARTESEMIRELADDEAAYRSLTLSWFEHSPLQEIIKKVAESKTKLIITTDHGTVRVNNPVKIVGEKSVNSNLRYKVGRNLSYNEKSVFSVQTPEDARLPKTKMSSEFVFASQQDYFVYPNNYNHFAKHFQNTFQHGGISLEEILIPYIELNAK
jgi:CheY-like chemotaxis protein